MNFLRILYILGISANLITSILYVTIKGMDNTMGYIFLWMPILWIGTFGIAVIVLALNFRVAFSAENWSTSVFALLICTPLPSLLLYYLIIGLLPPGQR